MEYKKLIEQFLAQEKPGAGAKTITKYTKRLNESIEAFQDKGITMPTEQDYEEILKPYVQGKPGKKGKLLSESVVKDWLSLTIEFYKYLQGAEEYPKSESEEVENEGYASSTPVYTPERKIEQPVLIKRDKKITIYTTGEMFSKLALLADFEEITMTELVNNIFCKYLSSRTDDLEFLYRLEQEKRERRFNQQK